MTESKHLLPSKIHKQPFTDIINHSLNQIPQDLSAKVTKPNLALISHKSQHQFNQKQNENDGELNQVDKTFKKQAYTLDTEALSPKATKKELPIHALQIQDNPQWEFLNKIQGGEVSHVLRLQCQFSDIINLYLQLARKSKLIMCQHTESFVTVKKGGLGSCRCIFKIWSDNETDITVYQLRKCGRTGQRAKLILVEGDQIPFNRFFFAFLRILQEKTLVKVLPCERVQLIFDQQRQKTTVLTKKCDNISKRLKKQKKVKNQEIQNLVANIKTEAGRLNIILANTPDIQDTSTLQRQMQDLCYQNTGVLSIFEDIYSQDFEQYRLKRQKLLKKYNISELFKQLQISEHFDQFKRQHSLKQIQTSQEKIPYINAIRQLKRFATLQSSSAALESVVVFNQKIRQAYQQYFRNYLKMGDMDDYLPITIFCVLAADCEQNFLALVKFLIAQVSKSEESQWQKKTLTDLQAAFEYILHSWDCPN